MRGRTPLASRKRGNEQCVLPRSVSPGRPPPRWWESSLHRPLPRQPSTTTTALEVLVGTLDIDARPPPDLGDGAPGGTITGQLGTVTITDSRGAANTSWVASVTATVFQTGGASPPETILPEEINYSSARRRRPPATAPSRPGRGGRRRRRSAVQRHPAHRVHPLRRHRRQHRPAGTPPWWSTSRWTASRASTPAR